MLGGQHPLMTAHGLPCMMPIGPTLIILCHEHSPVNAQAGGMTARAASAAMPVKEQKGPCAWHLLLKGVMDPMSRYQVPKAAWTEATTATPAHAERSMYLATSLRKVRPAQTRSRSSNTHLLA